MKRLLNRTLAVLLLASSVVLVGCFEDNTIEYDGPPAVEFKPTAAAVAAGSGTVNLPVQLIAPHQNRPLEISYRVVDSLTTAQAGVHYNLSGTTFTIPANSSFGEIPVDVLAATTGGVLAVELLGNEGEGVVAAENYDTFLLTIQP